MFKECLENVRKNVPLVHNITNYVTVNDVANVLIVGNTLPDMAVTVIICIIVSKFKKAK